MDQADKAMWPQPARAAETISLSFGNVDKKVLGNISAGTRRDGSLFVSADEFASIDRLSLGDDGWGDHASYDLADLLPLANPELEADIEGLAAEQDWLWVVGSHARTRAKPEKAPDECIDLAALADLKDTRSRCLLARMPLVRNGDGWRPVARDGARRAGMLKQSKHGTALSRLLKHDPLIGPFTRVPAKEGGLDIEGIAVCGDRVALGFRGPVIATFAVLLELSVAAKRSGRLVLDGEPVKRLLDLDGLGIRDLKRCGDDLLILAGPTTGLSGPCQLYRWRGWVQDPPQDAHKVRLHRPELLLDLPFGRGCDHPEGLALWEDGPGGETRILVICDSPSKSRVDAVGRTITADLFSVP